MSHATRTEKEKMIAGDLYRPGDPQLSADRQRAKALCFRLNQTCPTDPDQRQALTHELLSAASEAWVESPFHCDYGYNITTGKGFYANHGCTLLDCAPIRFGDNCMLAPGVVIATATHPLDPVERASGQEFAQAITVGSNVWFGANVTVCPGVSIGDNVVIGAGSVVVKDLPSNSVCVGSPAKPIRFLTPGEQPAPASSLTGVSA